MERDTLVRSALGRVAELGDLYNARTDCFLGVSALSDKIPPDAVMTEDRSHTDVDYVYSEQYSEKMNKIDISAELKISFLSNLVPIQGSAQYLSDVKTSARTIRSTLVCKIDTKADHLNLYHKQLKNSFSRESILTNSAATHMVVSVRWGANVFATVEADVGTTSESSEMTLGNNVSSTCMLLGSSIKADKATTWTDEQSRYKVKFYGDAILTDKTLPSNVAGAQTFLANIPQLVANAKNGKGDQISYTLVPIGIVTNYLGIALSEVKLVKLNTRVVNQFIEIFDDLSLVNQKLNDLYNDTVAHDKMLTTEDVDAVKKYRDTFVATLDAQRDELGVRIVKVRSGVMDAGELEILRDAMLNGEYSAKKVSTFLRNSTIANLIGEMQLLDELEAKGVVSVDNEEAINNYITMYDDVFVFYPHSRLPLENERLNNKELRALLNVVEKNSKKISEKKMAFLYAPHVEHNGERSTFHFQDGILQAKGLPSSCVIL